MKLKLIIYHRYTLILPFPDFLLSLSIGSFGTNPINFAINKNYFVLEKSFLSFIPGHKFINQKNKIFLNCHNFKRQAYLKNSHSFSQHTFRSRKKINAEHMLIRFLKLKNCVSAFEHLIHFVNLYGENVFISQEKL